MNSKRNISIIRMLFISAISFLLILGTTSLYRITSKAVVTTCNVYDGGNICANNYYIYSQTIQSYLISYGTNGLMRVQGNAVEGKILVEYYDENYNIKGSVLVPEELPIFGAFYEADSNYYILSGQMNYEESDSVEVYRITKYDKNWSRISSCSLYGANTHIPFYAGSARITSSDKYMFIRTCHQMYKTDDGLNHQANVTIQVDMNEMTVVDSKVDISAPSYGYVSHSFNQFIKIENNSLITVDHGDGAPRSIALIKYSTDFLTESFVPDYNSQCEVVDMFSFVGTRGSNYTGTSIGGFEISNTSYMVAGNATDQLNNYTGITRNIFVAVAKKDSGSGIGTPEIKWITNYKESETITSTPHFVKINDNKFILMWQQFDTIYYTQINAEGNRVGSVYTLNGNLTDCVPVQINGKLIWYAWVNEEVTFYEIDISDISKHNMTVINNGHKFVVDASNGTNNTAKKTCSVCNLTENITVPTSYEVSWSKDSGYYYSSEYEDKYYVGDRLDIRIDMEDSLDNNDMIIEISDSSIASLDNTDSFSRYRSVTMNKVGNFTLTIYPRYNPKIKKTYNFNVVHKYNKISKVQPTYISKGYTINRCEICGKTCMFDYVNKLKLSKVISFKQKSQQSTTSISMSWKKVSDADGYEIYRANSKKGKYIKVKVTTSTSFKNGKLKRGKTYYYKVRAYKTVNGNKIYGKFSSVKAMGTKPKTPSINVLSGNSKAKVVWKKISGISGYEVYMATSKSGTFYKIKTSGSKNTAYLKKGLISGKKYYFKVRSYRTVGGKKIYSSWSKVKGIKIF